MQLEWLKKLSLKAKMALAAAGLFVLFILTTAYFATIYFERAFKNSIFTQQASLVANMADNIDGKLRIAQRALEAVAKQAPRDAFTNADSAQRFLDDKVGLLAIFDNGIFFIDNKGILKAESPYRAKRRGKDLSFRDWVQKTVASQKPQISDAYISTHTPGQPAIVMTVPVFDQKGKMTGMMTGSLDLLGENFLAQLSSARIGKAGYFFIIDNKRTLVVHADKSRIMAPAAPPGANRMVDRAIGGFEGSGETVTSYGAPMLFSCKRLRTTSWILAANYPMVEAYAPLERAKHYMWAAALAGTLILLLSSWLVMRRLLSPLAVLTRHVSHLPENSGAERLLDSASKDEIGVLVTAFNAMVTTLDSQQEILKRNEAHYRAMVDAFDGLIYICSPDYRIEFMNEQLKARSGRDATGEFCYKVLHGLDAVCPWCVLKQVLAGETVRWEIKSPLDNRWYGVSNTPINNANGIISKQALIIDITESKLAEDKLHQQTLQLVQEVTERQKTQEYLLIKQQQLEELNDSLEERVSQAVAELRRKDQLLIQQGRLAAMGDMINNIAHQWRQPLNNIGLIVQNLHDSFRDGALDAAEMAEQTARTMQIIMHMSGTINDFRNFFRADKERLVFTVNQAVSSAINFLSSSLTSSGIEVECHAQPELSVDGYPNEYLQALLNIVNNARDVLLERRIAGPRISIAIFREEDRVVVTVSDNGGGIAPNILPKVFDPYFTTKELGKGTGIGLYMSKTIIEQNMAGSLTARNIDHGAEFRIELRAVSQPSRTAALRQQPADCSVSP